MRVARLLAIMLVLGSAAAAQPLTTLRIHVVLTAADGTERAVPRFALLVSDNPASAPPRRAVTASDGTAELHLPPGSYTIESDRPVAFEGRSYEWAQTVTLSAGRELAVELNAGNALAEDATPSGPGEPDPSAIEMRWRDSIVEIWSATAHGSAFVIDSRGLLATNQRVVGDARTVEVQVSPTVKVPGRVVAADAVKNVAIVWVDPGILSAAQPMPLGSAAQHTPKADETVFSIGIPLLQDKLMTSGTIRRVDAHTIDADVDVANGSAGGPVFTADGDVIGITTLDATSLSALPEIVRIDNARELIATAVASISGGERPPKPVHLPVESTHGVPRATLEARVSRDGVRIPYHLTTDDFDVRFITPVMTFGAERRAQQAERQARARGARNAGPPADPLEDFANWRDYVTAYLPVLMIRVSPQMGEGFWQMLGRAAAQTQGVAIPAFKHIKARVSAIHLYCGGTEVAPIHPFTIVHPLPEAEGTAPKSIEEKLYVFAPDATGPQCGAVKLTVISDDPAHLQRTIDVDPAIVERIHEDLGMAHDNHLARGASALNHCHVGTRSGPVAWQPTGARALSWGPPVRALRRLRAPAPPAREAPARPRRSAFGAEAGTRHPSSPPR